MAIPDYQTLMLPLLRFLFDKQEHAFRDAVESLAREFNLTDEEKKELLPSGQQPIFHNRVGWASTYMKKALLIEAPRRGALKITERGIEVLKLNPPRVDVQFLAKYPEFIEFRLLKRDRQESPINEAAISQAEDESHTPEESLDFAFQKIRQDLSRELLEQVKRCSPEFFERLVVELLVKMGYGGSRKDAGKAIGRSGDGGIDGIIKEDRLGLDVIYIQAKRWEGTVSRPEIQKFAGALQGHRARKGVFITTSRFSDEALEYSARIDSKIVLIDGEQLAHLMIDFDIGVSGIVSYEIKKIDSDYFTEE